MRKKTFFTFVTIVTVILITGIARAETEKYVIGVPVLEGLDATNLSGYLKNMAVLLQKKLGCEVTAEQIVYRYGDRLIDLLEQDIKKGRVDIAYINGLEYVEYLKTKRKDLVPLFTVAMDRRTIMDVCLFVRRGDFTSVSELRGKKWAGAQLRGTRYLLYKSGINEPLEKFFGQIQYVSDAPMQTLVGMLEKGEIDVFSTFGIIMRISGEMGKKDSVIEKLYCEDFEPTWVFVARGGVPRERISQIQKIMLNAHKDPDFAAFRFAFQLIDGRFVPMGEDSLKKAEPIVELILKNGWNKEEAGFHEKYHYGTDQKK